MRALDYAILLNLWTFIVLNKLKSLGLFLGLVDDKHIDSIFIVIILGGCEVAASSEGVVQDVAKLLAVEPAELKMSLATRVMTTTKGGGFGTMYKYVELRS